MNKKDLIKLVASSVKQEFEAFKNEEKSKSIDEIFNDYYQIYFYCRVSQYLTFDDFNPEEENVIKKLAKYGDGILNKLYGFYLDIDYAKVDSFSETCDFIEIFNESCQASKSNEME